MEAMPSIPNGEVVIDVGAISVSEAISIEEFLQSESAYSIDVELLQELGYAIMQNSLRTEEGFQFFCPTSYVEFEVTKQELPLEMFHMYSTAIARDADYISYENMIVPAAVAADLQIWDLATNGRQPLPHNTTHTFSFIVGNVGAIAAHNVQGRIYLGQAFLGTMNLSTINPSRAYIFSFNFSLPRDWNMGGAQEMVVRVSTTSHETNFTNNTVRQTFLWAILQTQNTVDLVAAQIHSHPNNGLSNYRFTAAIPQMFYFDIFNVGNTSANNVMFSIWVNNQAVRVNYSLNQPIPPNTFMRVGWDMRVSVSGTYAFQARVEDRVLPDSNPGTNTLQRFLFAEPDGCGYLNIGWRIANPHAITISTNCSFIGIDDLWLAANAWGSAAYFVNFSAVSTNNDNAMIAVYSSTTMADNVLGVFYMCSIREGIFGSQYVNRCSITGTFSRGHIRINQQRWNQNRQASAHVLNRAILKHEIGHIFGLGHPCYTLGRNLGNGFCHDPAIMRSSIETFSHFITPHDVRALERRFGR
ncbi:MAG: hypothetical protein FWC78_03680 [Defluviitaleaceae bacterium]|nr:hypothetical protein [Defluviitaleaceae bacterium]